MQIICTVTQVVTQPVAGAGRLRVTNTPRESRKCLIHADDGRNSEKRRLLRQSALSDRPLHSGGVVTREYLQQFADSVAALERVAEGQLRVHRIPVFPADLLYGKKPLAAQFMDDALSGSLGNPDHLRYLTQPDVGLVPDHEQHMSMVGQKCPVVCGGSHVRQELSYLRLLIRENYSTYPLSCVVGPGQRFAFFYMPHFMSSFAANESAPTIIAGAPVVPLEAFVVLVPHGEHGVERE